ncbi:MAG: hypothetical protein ACTHJT_10285 [Cytophaga sp.]|uniref:hypothetical protein n=1 Tax=Cytophaga sp. TaxID=29535 RepID=UPI003F7FDF74
MIKQQKILFAVLLNTIFAFLLDLLVGYKEGWLQIILIEVPIIIIAFLALKWQLWAYIAITAYYFIRSFNLYFENFYLITKNGLNFEFKMNSVAINVFSFIFFLLLISDLKRRLNSSRQN